MTTLLEETKPFMQPDPIPKSYDKLLSKLEDGDYQIPKFQRDFVWEKSKVALLIDSILKGYPVGTFILWKTKDKLNSLKKIGNTIFKDPPKDDYIYYVLDGQQRMTSLYLAINGIETEYDNYSELYIDLDKTKLTEFKGKKELIIDSNENICVVDKPQIYITVKDLMNLSITEIINKFKQNLGIIQKIEILQKRIKDYRFSTIEVENQPIDVISDIFTRINTSGKELTLFEIMNAKVYDEKEKFILSDKCETLQKELAGSGYENLVEHGTVILQVMSACLGKDCKRKDILDINKQDFIRIWDSGVKAIKLAVDNFKSVYNIPVSKLLPYDSLIVPLSYLFFINNLNPDLTNEQTKIFEKYMYRVALSQRFSSATETKLSADLKVMNKIKNAEAFNFEELVPLTLPRKKEELAELIKNINFSTSNRFCIGILDIMVNKFPKKFSNNGNVILDNSYLMRANSANYHHFFPKAYLATKGIQNENSIVNIVLIDNYLNQNEIRAKAPSEYIKDFTKENNKLAETLKSHLIDDINEFGIIDDNYEQFLTKRSLKIAEEIISKI